MTEATHQKQDAGRAYRVVCFDLDGTLLPQELEEFLGAYFKTLTVFMARRGVPVDAFKDALNTGTKAMMADHGATTNETAFWRTFYQVIAGHMGSQNLPDQQWLDLFNDFYHTAFGEIGAGVIPDQNMVQAVKALQAKGYPLVLTTMPLFPLRALDWRLQWAGLTADCFLRLTNYENSTSVKPRLEYYAENLAAMGVAGEDVLMVGNNTVEDLAFTKLGADAYLVTDHLLDPVGLDLNTVRHSDSAGFLAWIQGLPACQNPVEAVAAGVVDGEAALQAYRANLAVTPEQLAQAAKDLEAARNAADDIGDAIGLK